MCLFLCYKSCDCDRIKSARFPVNKLFRFEVTLRCLIEDNDDDKDVKK